MPTLKLYIYTYTYIHIEHMFSFALTYVALTPHKIYTVVHVQAGHEKKSCKEVELSSYLPSSCLTTKFMVRHLLRTNLK